MKSTFAAVPSILLLAGSLALAQEGVQLQPQALASAELDSLVAPVALYPDPLLNQALAASRHPLDIVDADQWFQFNRTLRGSDLAAAIQAQNWDPSVRALAAVPAVIHFLAQDVRWTGALGTAFATQPDDVMSAVQRLREQAVSSGKLQSTPQQQVVEDDRDGQTAILIEPTDPDAVYVPDYDPAYVWGVPADYPYPLLAYPSFGFGFGTEVAIASGLDNSGGSAAPATGRYLSPSDAVHVDGRPSYPTHRIGDPDRNRRLETQASRGGGGNGTHGFVPSSSGAGAARSFVSSSSSTASNSSKK